MGWNLHSMGRDGKFTLSPLSTKKVKHCILWKLSIQVRASFEPQQGISQ